MRARINAADGALRTLRFYRAAIPGTTTQWRLEAAKLHWCDAKGVQHLSASQQAHPDVPADQFRGESSTATNIDSDRHGSYHHPIETVAWARRYEAPPKRLPWTRRIPLNLGTWVKPEVAPNLRPRLPATASVELGWFRLN